ncbi:DegV family protein [Caproiciproducens galactitolivorans]|uniref:DegV domain-containing protein n=1 Tax=Caproiciproducens galactitolivorans TaxID=642589 RepID=A0A4Z0Y0I4_9FIRM|nr:DegV family protein [Caproiciproducens galactitolivorans]QEY35670.1 DegV family protein [Caproiciproducens galactitolivorans]TGJ77399.1 DegV domain-containing protein [Caproiciproducens galactitolivorans]
MSEYEIITDSTTDLSPKLIEELDIQVIPMTFTIGDVSYSNYPDERELSSRDFYERLRNGETSTTNQISPVTFTEYFEPVLQSGKDVIYIAFSSGLSGTYNNARLTAEELSQKYPNRKIFTVDTLAASMGEGLLAYYAAKMRKNGASIDEVRDWLIENRGRLAHWFTVDDLNHLKRGGRVSGAAALVGTMLGIKPVLHVDSEGHLIPVEKVRGRRQSLDALIHHMKLTVEDPDKQMIFISHGDSLEDAEYIAEQVRKNFHVKSIEINSIGPVIGAHSGPGTIALFFLGKNRD